MLICYVFAIFIAPIGLAFLYFYHTHQEKVALKNKEAQEAQKTND